ncbi:DUF1489 family protein [Chachezhania sediminis]|uniref:DUF1489 family protein n=1 Tax=Chachezhania sediminis TaxID=2599291 RepID=UPI00131EC40B|nr:DUF1489 domain-containing protein [Chachezhania sediminis]
MTVHLVKLCVGADDIEDLALWQKIRRNEGVWPDGLPRHVTRMWPKREADLLDGGSLYWVIKGVIQCRQRIVRLDEVTAEDGTRRCALVMEPEIVLTTPAQRRPFQGWRYLAAEDAPRDLPAGRRADRGDVLPPDLDRALADIGVL